MKKLRLMSLIVLIPIVLGIVMLIVGSVMDNETARYVGVLSLSAGVPATMFVLVVVGLVLMMTGRLNLSDSKSNTTSTQSEETQQPSEEKQQQSEREKEYLQLADINTSRRYESKIKEAEYISRHTSEAYKNSTVKQKILGWLFFGCLIGDFALIVVFGMLRIWIGAIVCFCLFGGTILISLLVTVIRQKISMSGVGKRKKGEVLDGVVKSCTLSSTTSTGSNTVRIAKVVYAVTVTVNENEYTAYSEDFYEKGENIKICRIGKRLATILDDEELEELEDDYEPLD